MPLEQVRPLEFTTSPLTSSAFVGLETSWPNILVFKKKEKEKRARGGRGGWMERERGETKSKGEIGY